MNCKNCNALVDDNGKFCPTCGHALHDSEQHQNSPRLAPRWFKWLLGILSALVAIGLFLAMGSEDITNVVEDQLKAIRENKLPEAYYNYTTKEFQEATPLDKFKEFVKSYPAFSNNKSIRFTDRKADESLGTLDAVLMTTSGKEIKAQYRLALDKSTGKWKIQSVKFEDVSTPLANLKAAAPADELAAKKVVGAQLEHIRKKEFQKAYEETTSANFRKSTSRSAFDAFVNTQTGFFNYKAIEWNNAVTDGNNIILNGTMITTDGQKVPVAFQLENEKEGWRVLQIQVGTQTNPIKDGAAIAQKKLEFSQFMLGTDVDEEGIINKNYESFPKGTKDIFLNIYIVNGTEGAKIKVELEHEESHTKIPSVETDLKEDGNAIVRVVFSPPPDGWPSGNYKINAASSTGAKRTYDFKIE